MAEQNLKVLLVGAGALGSMFTWRLQTSGRVQVTAVCRSNYQAVKDKGFRIESVGFDGTHTYRPDRVVKTVEEAVATGETYDFVLVCTKALPNLGDNSEIIAPAVTNSAKTVIVLIQNGVGIEEPFRARYPKNPIASAVAYIDVNQPSDGVISHGGVMGLVMGLFPESTSDAAAAATAAEEATSALQELADLWNGSGVGCAVVDSIQPLRWLKLVWNASFNTVAVVSGGNDTHQMLANPECKALVRNLMAEVYRLGETVLGAPLPERLGMRSPDDFIEDAASKEHPVVPSMLMDFWAKRPLEHEVILGRPVRIARDLGVPVPYLEAVYALLVMVEKSYMRGRL
ncbi:hypothetical protein H4S06_000875 [Coemansia sp. BCRC 34490]|nr:hypothetical protein H4S06_000875 [Coemansia sp. BCRC 34490]